MRHISYLTEHFTISEPTKPSIDEFYTVWKRRLTNLKDPKLRKARWCYVTVGLLLLACSIIVPLSLLIHCRLPATVLLAYIPSLVLAAFYLKVTFYLQSPCLISHQNICPKYQFRLRSD